MSINLSEVYNTSSDRCFRGDFLTRAETRLVARDGRACSAEDNRFVSLHIVMTIMLNIYADIEQCRSK